MVRRAGWMWGLAGAAVLALLAMLLWPAPTLPRAAIVAPLRGDVAAGKKAFFRCAECHQIGAAAHNGFGPQLNGVVGRRAGSRPNYQYSAAMRQSGIVWTDQALAAFLRAPSDVVPGTKMGFWGIGDAQQIADLLAYLHTQQSIDE